MCGRVRALAFAAAAGLVPLAAGTIAQERGTLDAAAIRRAVEGALAFAPRGFEALQVPRQTGVRVNDVDVRRTSPDSQRITLDLSQKTLTYEPSGDVEALLDHVVASTAALTARGGHVEYRFLVDGLPLDRFLSTAGAPPSGPQSLAAAPRVVVSAGHGWYWHHDTATWRLQRDYYWGIVEDFVNWDIASYVHEELRHTRLEPWPAREPERRSARGSSGHPAWQEGATYFVRALGAPPSVWDIGINDYARDINSRPFYANWIESALVVSIHNNGGGGSGTETWFDETNGQRDGSYRLAEIINRHVVTAIRAQYDPAWPDRGLRSCNGCKGENRLAARPAVILEVAFMDTKTPDNDALHDERFKQIVARAIRDAVHEWAGLQAPVAPMTE